MVDRRARQKELNTLACVPIGLKGYTITVELINDAYVTGKLIDSDAMMNIDMENAKYVDGNGESTTLHNFHVKGRKIRNIQIPDEIDVMKVIKSVVTPKPFIPRKTTIREKIILKRDNQTLKRYARTLAAQADSDP